MIGHDPLNSRPPVEATLRRRMTPARKRRIHGLADGRCGCGCGEPVPVSGPGVEYEHEITVWDGGLDDWPNLRPWTPEHHKPKTARDAKARAKTKRRQRMTKAKVASKRPLKGRSTLPKGRKLQGAGFRKGGPKRRIRGRGFRR